MNSASPNINIDLISKDNHGRTALIVAYGYSQYDVVKLEIDNHCVFRQKQEEKSRTKLCIFQILHKIFAIKIKLAFSSNKKKIGITSDDWLRFGHSKSIFKHCATGEIINWGISIIMYSFEKTIWSSSRLYPWETGSDFFCCCWCSLYSFSNSSIELRSWTAIFFSELGRCLLKWLHRRTTAVIMINPKKLKMWGLKWPKSIVPSNRHGFYKDQIFEYRKRLSIYLSADTFMTLYHTNFFSHLIPIL